MPSKNEKSQRGSSSAQAGSGRGSSRGSSQMDTENRSQELQRDSGNVTAEGETSRHVTEDMSPMGRADESADESSVDSEGDVHRSSDRETNGNTDSDSFDSDSYEKN